MTTRLMQVFAALRNDKRAVTALEYGLIASLISVAIVASVTTIGSKVSGMFTSIVNAL
jgi:pilus assembly protein Flp/PilA